jgi:hypothetical protein
MPPEREPDEPSPRDEVLSQVDALLRRHRNDGLDVVLDAGDPDIPTLTDFVIEPSPPPAEGAGQGARAKTSGPEAEANPVVAEHPAGEVAEKETAVPPGTASAEPPGEDWMAQLRPEIERIVMETLAARLRPAIQEQVMPQVMVQLGAGLNRLRDAMRPTVESVVRETIEHEVKAALQALLKERTENR